MIAVIADDFTGAAEIGGVGIRHGFRVVIETNVVKNVDTDILIIATDTRSQSPENAATLIKKITSELLALHPEFIYKKIDSILRGNVGEELIAQLKVSFMQRALLIPANPNLKRTIKEGIYYYDGVPLNEFNFTNGTAKKRQSSNVIDLIGEPARHVTSVISSESDLGEKGLMIGNTSDSSDLDRWVQKIDSQTIPSGGSSFFDAILRARKSPTKETQSPIQLGEKILYVCGSAFIDSRMLVQAAKKSGQAVVYMPENLFCADGKYENLVVEWTKEITETLEKRKKVIIAIDQISCNEIDNIPLKIRHAIAGVVEHLVRNSQIDELIIEGGATAYSIIQTLKFTKFYPTHELAPGSIRMKVEENKDIFLTLKPGSYVWPESVWQY
jgi:uncharacterized protein YgbK (DUF1537 family)